MASKKKNNNAIAADSVDDFSSELINALNEEFQLRVAYNLGTTESPTHVKNWISTSSLLLDYAIANKRNGGVPSGRIIEIYGEPSTGKSHIAFALAKRTQEMGGLVVYIDTENAVPVDKLATMGIDVTKRFVYCDTHQTESVFKILESVILKASQINKNKDVPILAVWDSIAATSPKAELEGDYEDNTMGLQARVISKSMRKITGIIGQNNVTFLCLNQVRQAIGVMFGDNTAVPGGKSVAFHASVRVALTGGTPVKDKNGNVIGSNVNVTIKKNKVAPPFKKLNFQILFGKGIDESDSLFEVLYQACKDNKGGFVKRGNKEYSISGASAWRQFTMKENGEVVKELKFQKSQFEEKVLNNPELKEHLLDFIDEVLVTKNSFEKEVEEDLEGDE